MEEGYKNISNRSNKRRFKKGDSKKEIQKIINVSFCFFLIKYYVHLEIY